MKRWKQTGVAFVLALYIIVCLSVLVRWAGYDPNGVWFSIGGGTLMGIFSGWKGFSKSFRIVSGLIFVVLSLILPIAIFSLVVPHSYELNVLLAVSLAILAIDYLRQRGHMVRLRSFLEGVSMRIVGVSWVMAIAAAGYCAVHHAGSLASVIAPSVAYALSFVIVIFDEVHKTPNHTEAPLAVGE